MLNPLVPLAERVQPNRHHLVECQKQVLLQVPDREQTWVPVLVAQPRTQVAAQAHTELQAQAQVEL